MSLPSQMVQCGGCGGTGRDDRRRCMECGGLGRVEQGGIQTFDAHGNVIRKQWTAPDDLTAGSAAPRC